MLFVVRFEDKPDHGSLREKYLDDHISWLDTHRDTILVAGSLREQLGSQPVGGLWIVEAASKAEVESVVDSDPFWKEGLRESYEVLHWSKAFESRKTLV